MQFHKYHGLGNDYIVLDPQTFQRELAPETIERICSRHFGVGSDGILLGPLPGGRDELPLQRDPSRAKPEMKGFALRIFNPDGSEAEKSGNGLRIFARYLWDCGLVECNRPFAVHTLGGPVSCLVVDPSQEITVEMGRVSFSSRDIPVSGPERQVLNELIQVGGYDLSYSAATIGNPHCVVLCDATSPEFTKAIGPVLESEARFPNRTNVQFMRVLDRQNIQIEIWERGAGYTLASGSSASASAAVAYRLGLCDGQITVHMPGGNLHIAVDNHYEIRMTGPVATVAKGQIAEELLG